MILISKIGFIRHFLSASLFLVCSALIAAQEPTSSNSTALSEVVSSAANSSELSSASKTLQKLESTNRTDHKVDNLKSSTQKSSNIEKRIAKNSLSKLTMGLLTAAKTSIKKGEYEVAEEAYRQTLLQSDIYNDVKRVQKVSLQLARLLKRMKQFEEAVAIYSHLDLKTSKPEVHLEYIRLLHDSGANQKALDNCKVLLENYPDFLKAELTAGMITKSNGDFVSSLLHFDRYLAMHPKDPLALLETGNLLEKMKQWKQAKMLYDKLLELQPDNRQALRNRGNTLVHMEKYALAVEDLTASGMQAIPWVERLLRYAKGQIDIARAKENKQTQKVMSVESKNVKSQNNSKVETADFEIRQNKVVNTQTPPPVDTKKQIIAKLNEIDFVEFSPKGNQSEQKDTLKTTVTTKAIYEEELIKSVDLQKTITPLNSTKIISTGSEKHQKTTEILNVSLDLTKDKTPLEKLSENSSQTATMSKLIQLRDSKSRQTTKKPAREHAAVLPTKGMELVDNRNYQRALPILRLEVKRYPENQEISNSLRVTLQSMSLFDDILRELDRILTHHPNDYDIQLTRSFYLLESGEVEAALETTLHETDPFALYIRATAMKKLGRFKDAQVLQKRLENLDERFADHQTGRFLWLVKLKDYLFAYPLGKKLIQANRSWLSFPMAVVSRALDYPVEAVLYLTQTVQDDPKNAKAYFELSQIMDQLNRPEDRDIFLQKALSIEPSNTQYKSYHQQLALKNP